MKERLLKSLPPSFHLSAVRSFPASGDYRSVVWDPVSSSMRVHSQNSPNKSGKLRLLLGSSPSYVSSAGHMAGGAEQLVPQMGQNNWVMAVYDDEPTSIISYALSSKEHDDWISNPLLNDHESNDGDKEDFTASTCHRGSL
ncbi:hypothetical protein Nepgr_017019 [Nepenthes gracilis]|uniref:Uncharacterized protein n=1 Tax=Nepenthes gracilis TaxID=150966 RepID=A0AAD3XS42_NEPGR|nr:hypothetical protein Nepgr_017019 [Nepenthes gracilis]